MLIGHDPCPTVPTPLPWLEVGGHVFHPINHHNYREVLVALSTFWLLEVDIDISNQDWFHAVWEVSAYYGYVIIICRNTWRYVAPENEPLHPPHLYLEAEDMGYKGLFRRDLIVGVVV